VSLQSRGFRSSASTDNPQMRSKLGLQYRMRSGSSEVIQMTSWIVSAMRRKRSSLSCSADRVRALSIAMLAMCVNCSMSS